MSDGSAVMNMRLMRWRYATGRSLDFTKAAEWRAEQVQPLLPESYQPHRTGPPQTPATHPHPDTAQRAF
jgi:hypothetical protein